MTLTVHEGQVSPAHRVVLSLRKRWMRRRPSQAVAPEGMLWAAACMLSMLALDVALPTLVMHGVGG